MTSFETMQTHYQQRGLAARKWKEEGGQVIGYFCDNVLEELILAAGFFPIRLSGDPWEGTEEADEYKLPVPHIEFVDSMLNKILTGRYDFIDYLIIPHGRDQIYRMWQILHHITVLNPELRIPETYFLDTLHTPFYTSGLYDRDRTFELKKKLEEWSGNKITEEALSKAIAIGNENKMLLKKVAELRAADQPRISGVEALQIIGSSMFMLKEDHNKLLKEFLDHAEQLPVKEGIRIFIEGSPLDNLQLYELIESGDAVVVAEDNCWGNRYSDVPVEDSSDPLEALIDRYHKKSPCPRMFPIQARIDYCLQSAKTAKAQGAIFYVYKDDAQAWEIPDELKVFKSEGIPTLNLKTQPYLISEPEKLKESISEFIRTIG
ncbi:2-hydroxyacyl-CoA dehydratase subunit D [Thermodesulfobacteriota bacterium]